jgi:uncharacterized protein (DUF1697 family)
VALLRAINVGTHGRISMADLRARCEKAGLEEVTTYIQTGNVLCSSGATAAQVTKALEEELQTRAFVLTPAQLRKAAKDNPLRKPGWRSHLLFLEAAPTRSMPDVEGYRFAIRGRVLYYAFPEEEAGRRRSVPFERLLGVAGTGRSAKVVDEIVERL